MNTKRKIAIDRILGVVAAVPLNYLVRLVGFITRFDHSLEKEKKRIVICKFKGMGSIVQATPLIATLKTKYPNATITFVSSIENKGIIDEIDWIDGALYVRDQGVFSLLSSSISLIFKLIRHKSDLYIDLEIYSNYSSIIATFSLATDRFGYYLKSSRYRLGMYTHMMYFNSTAPISDAYLQFARLLKCNEIIKNPFPFLKNETIENTIVINVNASDLRIERRWPADSFVALIKQIRKLYPNYEVNLVGSKSEQDYVSVVSSCFKEDTFVKDVSGKTNLHQLIELLSKSALVITNDTGPMHLAAAMQKNTIALFGPCSPSQYAIGKSVFPIYKNVYCSPCVHEFITPPCKGENLCMQLIEIKEVLQAVEEFFNQNWDGKYVQQKIYATKTNTVFGTVSRD